MGWFSYPRLAELNPGKTPPPGPGETEPPETRLPGRSLELRAPLRHAVLSSDGRILAMLHEDRLRVTLLDTATLDFDPHDLVLPEPVARMGAVGEFLCLVFARSGEVEFRPFDDPGERHRWMAPAGKRLVAAGLASGQPAAPLVLECEPTADVGPTSGPSFHFLDRRSFKPSRWELDGDPIPPTRPLPRPPSHPAELRLIRISPDGRTAATTGLTLRFNPSHQVSAVPDPSSRATDPPLPFKIKEWQVAGRSGDHLFVGGGIYWLPALDEAGLTVLDAKSLAPLCLIRGIGPPEYANPRAPMPTVFYSASSRRLLIAARGRPELRTFRLDLRDLRSRYPHQASPVHVRLPRSGILEHQVIIQPVGSTTGFRIRRGPDGATIDGSGRLRWETPLNLGQGSDTLFEIDAILKTGASLAVTLTVHKPWESEP